MQTSVHEAGRLPSHIAADLGSYRYRVFVEQLGWKLPSEDEKFERDQYDRDDTVYVLGRDANGEICGCARLLPTTRPYLLQEVFPQASAIIKAVGEKLLTEQREVQRQKQAQRQQERGRAHFPEKCHLRRCDNLPNNSAAGKPISA